MSSIPPPGWSPPAGARAAVPAAGIPSPALHLPAPSVRLRSPIWPRIAAFIADQVLAGLLAGFTVGLVWGPSVPTGVEFLAYIGVWALLRVVGPQVLGESPGKRLMHLQTVDVRTGEPLPTARLAVREILLWLVYWLPFVALLDAARTDRRDDHLSWRDRKAGTAVVRDRAVGSARVAVVMAIAVAIPVIALLSLHPSRGVEAGSPEQIAARWSVMRADAISTCVGRGRPRASCECVLDEAARNIGPQAMLLGDAVTRAAVVRAGETCRSRTKA